MSLSRAVTAFYKLDYNKVLDYHIEKKADITVVCKGYGAGRMSADTAWSDE